jgi:hypothetical protein
MANFNYQKWINSRISRNSNSQTSKTNNKDVFFSSAPLANSAISANPTLKHSKISKISSSGELKKYGKFSNIQLEQFLGKDWKLYKDNSQALQLWSEILANKEKMTRAGVYTAEQYENLFNNER